MGYRIKTVCEMTGIPKNTLLAWERRYGLVRPVRQPNGYREYSDQDVLLLQRLKASVDAGQSPSEAISLLEEHPPPPRVAPEPAEALLLERSRGGIIDALIRFDRREADQRFERLSGLPYARQIRELIFPVLREIGQRWAAGAIDVAHEHFASAWCRDQLLAMLMHLESGPLDGPAALLASLPGDRHELGLMGKAVLLALSGYRISYLGADVPLDDLGRAARARAPALLCVSATISPGPEALASYARTLRAATPPETRILIGGAAVDRAILPEIPGLRWAASLDD